MPTRLPRHTITETEPVRQALDPLRELGVPVDFPALVIRGAQAVLADQQRERADAQRRQELRQRFLERTRTGRGFDLDLLPEVRDRAWTRRR